MCNAAENSYPNLSKNTVKIKHSAVLLVHLLVLLVGHPCFCLRGLAGLIAGLAIGDVVSIAGKVMLG